MNEDIRQTIKSSGLCLCHVARKMGIYEHAFQRLLRKSLSDEQKNAVYKAIEIAKEEQK